VGGGMILTDVMTQLATQARTVTGLRVFDYPDGNAQVPALVILLPEKIEFDQTYGRGADRILLPALLLVSGAVPRKVRDDLGAYCSGSGPRSIKQVLEAGTYTAFDEVVVTGCTFDAYQLEGVTYPAALFDLEVFGKGA
jgi:hypothetical protein